MRFIEFLTEMPEEQIGVVISTSGGEFYDINFVDYKTQAPLTDGHFKNLAVGFIRDVNDKHDDWDDVFSFFEEHFQSQQLGGEYSSEAADHFLYGPITSNQMNQLSNEFFSFVENERGRAGGFEDSIRRGLKSGSVKIGM